jgi:hypothetical protein
MDLKTQRLSQGEKIAGGSALALFVCMFLGWFNFGFATANAWDSLHYASPILAIAIAATLTIVLAKANGNSLGDLPDGTVIFVLGCLATLLVLFRLIDPISAGDASPFGGGGGIEDGASAEAGLFLGLVAAAGIAVGGYLATGGRALDRVKAAFAGAGAPAPPAQSPVPPPPDRTPVASPPPAAAPPPPVQAPPPPASPTPADSPLPSIQAPPPPSPAPAAAPPSPAAPAPPSPPLPPSPPAAAPSPPVAADPSAGDAEVAFCEHCGARMRVGDRFCGECGQAIAAG